MEKKGATSSGNAVRYSTLELLKHAPDEPDHDLVVQKATKLQAWWRGVRVRKWCNLWSQHAGRQEKAEESGWAAENIRRTATLYDLQSQEVSDRQRVIQEEENHWLDINWGVHAVHNRCLRQFMQWEEADRRLTEFRANAGLLGIASFQEEVARDWLTRREEMFRAQTYTLIAEGWSEVNRDLPNVELKHRTALFREEHEEWSYLLHLHAMFLRPLSDKHEIENLERAEEEARDDVSFAEHLDREGLRHLSRTEVVDVFGADHSRFSAVEKEARPDIVVEYYDELMVFWEALQMVRRAALTTLETQSRRLIVKSRELQGNCILGWQELFRVEDEEFTELIMPKYALNAVVKGEQQLVLSRQEIEDGLWERVVKDLEPYALAEFEDREFVARADLEKEEDQLRNGFAQFSADEAEQIALTASEESARMDITSEESFAWESWFLALVQLHTTEDAARLAHVLEERFIREEREFHFDNVLVQLTQDSWRQGFEASSWSTVAILQQQMIIVKELLERAEVVKLQAETWSKVEIETAPERDA
eukprot:RCo044944